MRTHQVRAGVDEPLSVLALTRSDYLEVIRKSQTDRSVEDKAATTEKSATQNSDSESDHDSDNEERPEVAMPNDPENYSVLDGVPLFASLPAADRQAVGRCMNVWAGVSNKTICKQGDAGDAFYLIVEGTVRVSVGDMHAGSKEPMNERVVAELGAGNFFGEVTMLNPDVRCTATVVSVGQVICLTISHSVLMEHLSNIRDKLVSIAAKRLESTLSNAGGSTDKMGARKAAADVVTPMAEVIKKRKCTMRRPSIAGGAAVKRAAEAVDKAEHTAAFDELKAEQAAAFEDLEEDDDAFDEESPTTSPGGTRRESRCTLHRVDGVLGDSHAGTSTSAHIAARVRERGRRKALLKTLARSMVGVAIRSTIISQAFDLMAMRVRRRVGVPEEFGHALGEAFTRAWRQGQGHGARRQFMSDAKDEIERIMKTNNHTVDRSDDDVATIAGLMRLTPARKVWCNGWPEASFADIARHARIIELSAGATLYSKGDSGLRAQRAYVLLRGITRVWHESPHGEIISTDVAPGNSFGDAALLERGDGLAAAAAYVAETAAAQKENLFDAGGVAAAASAAAADHKHSHDGSGSGEAADGPPDPAAENAATGPVSESDPAQSANPDEGDAQKETVAATAPPIAVRNDTHAAAVRTDTCVAVVPSLVIAIDCNDFVSVLPHRHNGCPVEEKFRFLSDHCALFRKCERRRMYQIALALETLPAYKRGEVLTRQGDHSVMCGNALAFVRRGLVELTMLASAQTVSPLHKNDVVSAASTTLKPPRIVVRQRKKIARDRNGDHNETEAQTPAVASENILETNGDLAPAPTATQRLVGIGNLSRGRCAKHVHAFVCYVPCRCVTRSTRNSPRLLCSYFGESGLLTGRSGSGGGSAEAVDAAFGELATCTVASDHAELFVLRKHHYQLIGIASTTMVRDNFEARREARATRAAEAARALETAADTATQIAGGSRALSATRGQPDTDVWLAFASSALAARIALVGSDSLVAQRHLRESMSAARRDGDVVALPRAPMPAPLPARLLPIAARGNSRNAPGETQNASGGERSRIGSLLNAPMSIVHAHAAARLRAASPAWDPPPRSKVALLPAKPERNWSVPPALLRSPPEPASTHVDFPPSLPSSPVSKPVGSVTAATFGSAHVVDMKSRIEAMRRGENDTFKSRTTRPRTAS